MRVKGHTLNTSSSWFQVEVKSAVQLFALTLLNGDKWAYTEWLPRPIVHLVYPLESKTAAQLPDPSLTTNKSAAISTQQTHLIHLLELVSDDTETCHELVQSFLPHRLIVPPGSISLIRHLIQLLETLGVKCLLSLVLLNGGHIGGHLFKSLLQGPYLPLHRVLVHFLQLLLSQLRWGGVTKVKLFQLEKQETIWLLCYCVCE